ncbi:MAG: succinylglutamate-semialdehyde dehydrogenase [Bdellovibrionales bacterium]|nr:succinylglutamate-semialdehyde dehydrogenase [Bdellovibrionales bacterium]
MQPDVKGDLIGGSFKINDEKSGVLKVYSPADVTDLVYEGPYSYHHVDSACLAAHKAQPKWQKIPNEERFSYLHRVAEILMARKSELAEVISREVGKPLWESETEVNAMIGKVKITIEESMKLVSEETVPEILPGLTGVTRYRARGVMAVLGPFNFPGHLPNGHIIPALATGNTIVFKPSDKTPLTGQIIAEIMQAAELPEGVFNMIQGDAEVGRRLVVHELIHGVLFTGSYTVGLKIKQEVLNQHWKILALEMGGKNSSIVWKDANVEQALNENLVSSFITSGQRCSCTSRIFVHEKIYDDYLERFYEATKKIEIGHWKEPVFMGSIISEAMVANYVRYQEIALREGAKCIMRGKALEMSPSGYYVTPSIYEIPEYKTNSVYQKTELFSPNVAFYKVKDSERDKMFHDINHPGFGLALSVFTKDEELFQNTFQDVKVGLLNWNRGTAGASSRLPFGGIGKSGNDRPSAHFAVKYCTVPVACLEGTTDRTSSQNMPGISLY